MLVGGCRARGCRRRRGQAEGVDPEGVDARDERHRAALRRAKKPSSPRAGIISPVSFVVLCFFFGHSLCGDMFSESQESKRSSMVFLCVLFYLLRLHRRPLPHFDYFFWAQRFPSETETIPASRLLQKLYLERLFFPLPLCISLK